MHDAIGGGAQYIPTIPIMGYGVCMGYIWAMTLNRRVGFVAHTQPSNFGPDIL